MGSSRPGVPSNKQYLLGSTRRDEGVKKAAWQLEDALNRGKIVEAYPSTSQARETYFTVASSQYDFGFAMVVMIFLTLFESPVWCNNEDNFFKYMPSHERCKVKNENGAFSELKWNFTLPNKSISQFDTVLLSNVPYIPPGIGLILEVYLMCVVARKFLLERKLQLRYFQPLDAIYCDVRVASLGLAMVALDLVDCFSFAMWRPKFRVAFVARTFILCTLPGVRSLLLCALDVVKSVGTIMNILVGSILFFAWIAVTIFDDVDEGVIVGNATVNETIFERVNEGMDSFPATFYTMFVAGNTDEFVDCLLPTYSQMRWSGYLWFFFLTLVQILFLNMVLDTLVVTYLQNTEREDEGTNKRIVQGIRKSFRTLALAEANDAKAMPWQQGCPTDGDRVKIVSGEHEGSSGQIFNDKVKLDSGEEIKFSEKDVQLLLDVSKSAFLDLVKELSRSPASKTISPEIAGYLFDAVKAEHISHEQHDEGEDDQDERKLIVEEPEFLHICALLDCQCWTTQKYSPVSEFCPWVWKHMAWLRKKVTDADDSEDSSSFDEFMNTVLLLNLVMVVLETSYELNKTTKPPVLDSLELIFSFAYVMEVGVKLCVYSWAEYCSSGSNLFDFATTWLLLLSSLLEAVLKGVNFKAKRYMNILRLLRLVRVVKQLKRYKSVQFMIKTIAKLITSSTDLLSLLGIVVYFFTCLSVQLWGGLLHYDNKRLDGTEYKESNWLVLNFNDSLTAFGAWVVMLLCEYVPKYAEAVFHVLDPPYNRTWLIFLVFYFCGVCIVFELVKAFTIEVFLDCWKRNQTTEDIPENEAKEGAKASKKPTKPFLCFYIEIEEEEEDRVTVKDAQQPQANGEYFWEWDYYKHKNINPTTNRHPIIYRADKVWKLSIDGQRGNYDYEWADDLSTKTMTWKSKDGKQICLVVKVDDTESDTAQESGGDELKGLKIIKDKLKKAETPLCLHYTGGDKKKMKELHEEFWEQIEEEEEDHKQKEEESNGKH